MTNTKNKFNIKDSVTGEYLFKGCADDRVDTVVESLREFGYDPILETAAAGATSAGSIASNLSSGKGDAKFTTLKNFMNAFNNRAANVVTKKKDFFITISEGFDMDSVFSRLSSMEKAGQPKKTEGTTFGVEDDNGNLMKVTVRADQAKEFEEEVASYIADIRSNLDNLPVRDSAKELSMAELLYHLKDKFDIIDVDFPEIPKDVVYNADKASMGGGLPGDSSDGAQLADNGDGMNMDMNNEPLDFNAMDGADGAGADGMGADDGTGGLGLDGTDGVDLDDPDADLGMDFEPEAEDNEGSILAKVIDMLKSQAEADIEKAKAAGEQARADQARYSSQATQFAMKDEEERLRYEVEMEERKKKEKASSQMADMAKHRIAKTLGATGVTEAEAGATPEIVMRQRQRISLRYAPRPGDTPEDRAYKNQQKAEAMREWTSQYRQAVNEKRYNDIKNNEAKAAGKTPQQQQNRNPNQQQQQGNPNQQQNRNPNQQQQGNPNQQRSF